jgi:hypothetical protein
MPSYDGVAGYNHDICHMAIRDFASTEAQQRLAQSGKVEIANTVAGLAA